MTRDQKYSYRAIHLAILALGMLAGCQQQTFPTLVGSFPAPIPSATSFPTHLLLPTLLRESPSPTPTTHYQLTFVNLCQENGQCLYAIDMDCLQTGQPCIGEPQLLFEVSQNGQGPKPPIFPYSWSPNGQKVAIEATGVGGKGDIFVGDWAGQNWINLTNTPDYEGGPVWSPDNWHILFVANSGEPDYRVEPFWVTLDGKEIAQILDSLDISGMQQFSWSLDGEHLAFVHSDENGYSQIYVVNPDSSNLKQMTDQLANHFQPDLSPDGRWIVAIQELDKYAKANELILIPLDGSEKMRVILRLDGYIFAPTWSPLGDWIAFASDIEGHQAIYLIRSDGTGLTRVTQSNTDEYGPAWRILSP